VEHRAGRPPAAAAAVAAPRRRRLRRRRSAGPSLPAVLSLLPPPRPLISNPSQKRDAELRAAGSSAPRCHFFNTFFLTKLLHLEDAKRRGTYDYKEVRPGGVPSRGAAWVVGAFPKVEGAQG
jgi:hypothetical protein